MLPVQYAHNGCLEFATRIHATVPAYSHMPPTQCRQQPELRFWQEVQAIRAEAPKHESNQLAKDCRPGCWTSVPASVAFFWQQHQPHM